ncbi:MAG: hypothetical protein WBK96_03420 [Candidatus Manganitrophaceae bacterium]
MKKMTAGLLMLGLVFAANLSWAAMVSGKVVKADASSIIVKDDAGKEHKFVVDKTTKIEGDVKEGAKVQVDEDNGHAKSIKAG